MLTRRATYVGIGNSDDGLVAQDVVICDLVHITRLAPVQKPRRKHRGK